MHHLLQPFEHGFHRITHAQRLAGGIGQRQRRSIQRGSVQMLRFQARIQLRFIAYKPFTEARHWFSKRHHRQATHQVVEDVEVDHQLCLRQREVVHQVRQWVHKRQNNQAAHQLKQQTAERHAAGGSIGSAVIEHRQQARAEVSPDHQTQCDREGDRPCGGERGRQQHRRQAGITDDGKHRADERIQHNIAG